MAIESRPYSSSEAGQFNVMKKKAIVLAIVGFVIFLLALGHPRFYVRTLATWEYFWTESICTGHKRPRTPEGEQVLLRIWVQEVKPHTVVTNLGRIFPGEEYDMGGEGAWYGYVTLVFAGKDGATFLVYYPVNDPVHGHSRLRCKWFVPTGEYRLD